MRCMKQATGTDKREVQENLNTWGHQVGPVDIYIVIKRKITDFERMNGDLIRNV